MATFWEFLSLFADGGMNKRAYIIFDFFFHDTSHPAEEHRPMVCAGLAHVLHHHGLLQRFLTHAPKRGLPKSIQNFKFTWSSPPRLAPAVPNTHPRNIFTGKKPTVHRVIAGCPAQTPDPHNQFEVMQGMHILDHLRHQRQR